MKTCPQRSQFRCRQSVPAQTSLERAREDLMTGVRAALWCALNSPEGTDVGALADTFVQGAMHFNKNATMHPSQNALDRRADAQNASSVSALPFPGVPIMVECKILA